MKYCKCSSSNRMPGVQFRSWGVKYVCMNCKKRIDDEIKEKFLNFQAWSIIVIWLVIISFSLIIVFN